MNKAQFSRTVRNRLIDRQSNRFYEFIIRLFFRKVDFDSESKLALDNYAKNSKTVYVSFQSSNTSLLILISLLRRNGYNVPKLAFDFTPYVLQSITNTIRGLGRTIGKIFKKSKDPVITEKEYMAELMAEKTPVVLSLLSRKLFKRRYLEIKSDSLQYLVNIQKTSEESIYLMPQIMFWNRNPERTKTLITSRATGDRGLLSAIFTVLKSATPAFLRVGEPIDLKKAIEESGTDDTKEIAREIRNQLLETYNYEKRSILGPVIKSNQEMMEKVLYHKNVLEQITSMIENKKESEKKLRKKAFTYYKEIAADFSIIYIRLFEKTLDYIFNRIFDGIYYNVEDFKILREASQKGPLIIVPSHKSHMDYLIISSVFYQNKLIPPHILAGSNLTFFPMGKIFRRSGAFFMRRSFRGLDLYSSVFKQYVKTLIAEGYSIEFFLEGGRTRTGKLVHPKVGMLKYLIDAVDEGYNKDLVFVPTTINYDRILEESSYTKELKGKKKEAESTSGFVKSRKLLKRQYGRVYLNFNKPVTLSELRDTYEEGSDISVSIGNDLIKRINDVIMVTPFSLTTSAMLFSPGKGFTKEMIYDHMMILYDYLKHIGAPLSDALHEQENMNEAIDYVINSYKDDHIIMDLEFDEDEETKQEDDFYVLNEDERSRINFYKNSIIHFLLPVTFISIAILSLKEKNQIGLKKVTERYHLLKQFFANEFVYSDLMGTSEERITAMLDFLDSKNIIKLKDNTLTISEDHLEDLRFYARMIQEFVESYVIVLNTVLMIRKGRLNKKDLIMQIRKNGIKMFHMGEVKLLESLSMPNYSNALNMLISMGAISEEKISKKLTEVEFSNLGQVEGILETLDTYMKMVS